MATAANTVPTSPKQLMFSLLMAAVLCGMAVIGYRLIVVLDEQKAMSTDLAEMDDVRYGLLNPNIWVEHITFILQKKIREFDLNPKNRAAIKSSLNRMLDTLITEVDKYMRKQNINSQSWWDRIRGRMKQSVQDVFIDIDDIKTAIPEYADRILTELDKPEARDELNGFLKDVLSELSRSTFAPIDLSAIDAIQERYECEEWMFCRGIIQAHLNQHQQHAVKLAWAMFALGITLFILIRLESSQPQRSRFLFLALAATGLMACGVLTPMIEVEARISELQFNLLQEPVVFSNQMLYFQSKSVLDMVEILTSTGAWDMIGVGILIMMFSVLFPLAKLGSSIAWLYAQPAIRNNALIQFFALKSGKWSMADVFVVAIFMAYIGFDGIIASQLTGFAGASPNVDVLTTNGTSLEIGFFMFLGFCLFSLLTATWMESALGSNARSNET